MFSTVSLLGIIGLLSPQKGNFNNEPTNIERTQVKSANSDVNTLSIDKGMLDENVVVKTSSINYTDTSAYVTLSFSLVKDCEETYFVGYGDSITDPNEQKASLVYFVKDVDNTVEERVTPIVRKNKNSAYDGLGKVGDTSFTTRCYIDLEPGEELLTENDNESYKFSLINVFGTTLDDKTYVVERDEKGNLIPRYTNVQIASGFKEYDLSQFIDITFAGTSTFANYTSINLNIKNNVTEEFYPKINAATSRAYRQNADDIANGISYIRTRLNVTATTEYHIYYDGSDTPVILQSSPAYKNVTNNGVFEILLEGVDGKRITDFRIKDFYVYVDIFNNSDVTAVKSSNVNIRFNISDTGLVDLVDSQNNVLKPKTASGFFTDINIILIASILGFIVVYEGASFGIYVYLKKKYANDEFKRMNTKQYYKVNTMGVITLSILILTIEAIAFRLGSYRNSIAIYNPIDIIIVVGGIASILLVGYFIRYFTIVFKNYKEAKRNERLKLNKNALDDGTLQLSIPSKGE